MVPPAYMLKGLALEGGWTVGEPIDRPANATGGNFSCCYHVSLEDGTRGFLKALDFSRAFQTDDASRALQALTEAYNFERNLLDECRHHRMDRVVQAIRDGKVKVDDSIIGVVQYLIFEEADRDLRAQLDLIGKVETAWKLRSLHNIATGLKQLHGSGIAHQDVKPSNVLVFDAAESKIADLGRASKKGTPGPSDHYVFAGDPAYAAPESLYGYVDSEWNVRRFGCDLYHLGSMVVFFFTGLSMTSLVFSELPQDFRPGNWSGTYTDVLPYLRDAFARAIERVEEDVDDHRLRENVTQIVSQLCEPDPTLRGHPLGRVKTSGPLSLERYVSWFNLLACRAEIGIFGERAT